MYNFALESILVTTVFVRFNVVNSIHNFIEASFNNQYTYYTVCVGVVVLIVLLRNAVNRSDSTSTRNHTPVNANIVMCLLVFTFYVLVLLRFFTVDIAHTKYCTWVKPKLMYECLIISFTLVIFTKVGLFTNNYLLFVGYNFLFYSSADYVVTSFCIGLFRHRGVLDKVQLLHVMLIDLYLNSLHQLYSFVKNDYSFKLSLQPQSKYLCNVRAKEVSYYEPEGFLYVFASKKAKITLNERSGINHHIDYDRFAHHVPEKNLITCKGKLLETYNYELQILVETSSAQTFIVATTILLCLVKFLSVGSKNATV
jgi:hypothetical protein